jgi:hypothetical protein
MFTQLVKAVKRYSADIANQWVKVWLMVVHAWFSLVHDLAGATSDKWIHPGRNLENIVAEANALAAARAFVKRRRHLTLLAMDFTHYNSQ